MPDGHDYEQYQGRLYRLPLDVGKSNDRKAELIKAAMTMPADDALAYAIFLNRWNWRRGFFWGAVTASAVGWGAFGVVYWLLRR